MKDRITITISKELVDAADEIIKMKRRTTLQSDEAINRSTFIERAILIYLETLGFSKKFSGSDDDINK